MAPSDDLFTPILREPGRLAASLASPARDADEAEALATILGEVRRCCAKHVDGARIDERGALGPEILGAAAERGWFGLTIPARYGGAGLSMKAATRVVAELAGHNGSLGTCVGLHSGLALHALVHIATEPLRERYLPEIAAGRRIAAFAATEPGAGSDIAAVKTTLAEDAGTLRLSGSKYFVTNGGVCGLVTVLARSPGLGGARAGHTLVCVDPAWPGVERGKEEKKLGLKGSSTITIDFDRVAIPPDHVLGELSRGLDHAHRALTWGRTFMAAGCLGAAWGAIDEARGYTRDRVQFGRPLAAFPLVRRQTAQMIASAYAIESAIRLVCDFYESKDGDIGLDSAVAKVLASEGTWDVIDRGLQLMGGIGYIEEAGMARRMRDLRVTRIFEGANDVLRLHLASATLAWKPDMLRALPRIAPLLATGLHEAGARFDALMARLAEALVDVRKRLGVKLFERQVLQSVLADGILGTYATAAVLVRASGEVGPGGEPLRAASRAAALLAVDEMLTRAESALARAPAAEQPDPGGLVEAVLGE
jgi:alkylation response protein AidB-like acyl-CoA dehydrogenase